MFKIIKPDEFTLLPWKNGLGHTIELAINKGGNLNNFDWRLSIASVIFDGEFSNFSGYQRNLVLIEGDGLTLDHQNGKIDELNRVLDIAKFDGGCKTFGSLSNGSIKDFNIITKIGAVTPTVTCYPDQQKVAVKLAKNCLLFAYSPTDDIAVDTREQKNTQVPVNHLIQLSTSNNPVDNIVTNNQLTVALTGENMIVVQLVLH
jgi:environmental stress-induced protein Ves